MHQELMYTEQLAGQLTNNIKVLKAATSTSLLLLTTDHNSLKCEKDNKWIF